MINTGLYSGIVVYSWIRGFIVVWMRVARKLAGERFQRVLNEKGGGVLPLRCTDCLRFEKEWVENVWQNS